LHLADCQHAERYEQVQLRTVLNKSMGRENKAGEARAVEKRLAAIGTVVFVLVVALLSSACEKDTPPSGVPVGDRSRDLHWGDTASFHDPFTNSPIKLTVYKPREDPTILTAPGVKAVVCEVLVVNSASAGTDDFYAGVFSLRDTDGYTYTDDFDAVMVADPFNHYVRAGSTVGGEVGWKIPATQTPDRVRVISIGGGASTLSYWWTD
jgi:hypothetical protein